MKFIVILIAVCLSSALISQVDLAVQLAHSDDIVQLEFSNSGRFLVSKGRNNEFVIWDMVHGKSLSSFTLSSIDNVEGMKFSENEENLLIKTTRTTFFYSISKESITQQVLADSAYRHKEFYHEPNGNDRLSIKKGMIWKKNTAKKIPRYRLTVPNIKANFTAIDVNKDANLLLAVAEDATVYAYDFTFGIKKRELVGHTSQVFDVRFSPDGKTFVTAGRDRSIAIWDTESLKLKGRLASNVYRKKSVIYSHDGNKIYVGDELGYAYEIDFATAFPKIAVNRASFHALNRIIPNQTKADQDYFLLTSNNFIYRKSNPIDKEFKQKYAYRDHAFLEVKPLFIQEVFHAYQDPIGEITFMDQSPNGKFIIFSGQSDFPCITFSNVMTGKTERVYKPYSQEQWIDLAFLNDSTFIGIQDSSKILHFWMIDDKKTFVKTDTLPFVLQDFEVIDDSTLWLNTKHFGQFAYNPFTRIHKQIITDGARQIMKRNKFIILESFSGALDFYDLNEEKMYHRFIGHKEQVTDLNFHPDGDRFVTSSNDGTIRFWSLKSKRNLAVFIPFKNEEFVFITADNYYLMSKGAMNKIGFKVKGKYYYPEQFDLKYNRPDVVLNQLAFADKNLIEAYHHAYLKRLKKMNFTENQIRANFNLPELTLVNRNEIPAETTLDSIPLKLRLFDDLAPLDRINIWVNNVAVFGLSGVDLRAVNEHNIEREIYVYLAAGKNKIEINVLNQSGIESYKEQVVVEKTGIKRQPNLFVAAVGTSKHIDARYNLNFADKDANDLVGTLKKSPAFNQVNELVLTNEQVTLENLVQIKNFFAKAAIDDVVILFVAGHGVLDADFDYFFATHDMDFSDPEKRGVPYEMIEKLLDGIRAIKKILFIDTCHSGELDKDDVMVDPNANNIDDKDEQGEIIFRNAGVNVALKEDPLGLQSTNDLMKLLFTDLRKGTGATVVSSSGGVELSIEANEMKNGLFTYVLLEGLTSGHADLNEDGEISLAEIQRYTHDQVGVLSKGIQTPTARIQNNQLDYRLW